MDSVLTLGSTRSSTKSAILAKSICSDKLLTLFAWARIRFTHPTVLLFNAEIHKASFIQQSQHFLKAASAGRANAAFGSA